MKVDGKITGIRSDRETEFKNVKFDEFCNEHGINHNIFVPKTPQQNGIVERKNRTLVDIV